MTYRHYCRTIDGRLHWHLSCQATYCRISFRASRQSLRDRLSLSVLERFENFLDTSNSTVQKFLGIPGQYSAFQLPASDTNSDALRPKQKSKSSWTHSNPGTWKRFTLSDSSGQVCRTQIWAASDWK